MRTVIRKKLLLLLCILISLACYVLVTYIGRHPALKLVIHDTTIPLSSIQGSILVINILSCILMVFIDHNSGSIIGTSLIAFSFVSNLAQILRTHSLTSLPGLFTSASFLGIILIISAFYRKSDRNSRTDFITGLPNRRSFVEEVERRIQDKQPFWMCCLEIDSFKQINDIYGILAGDFILQKIAECFTAISGSKKNLFKMSGATFSFIFDGEELPADIIKRIMTNEHEQIVIPAHTTDGSFENSCRISFAAGIAGFPKDSHDSTTLLKHADIALSCAKRLPADKCCVYSEEMENDEIKQKEMELLINESIEHNYFYLMYQPQFTIPDKKLRGFETLIRCRKSDGSVISPTAFIPMAEKSNLIFKIDDYVLRRAMNEFKDILQNAAAGVTISVNISAKNISSPGFSLKVKALLEETRFPAQCLEIEITEYSLAESLDTTIANINELRKLGIQIALDDFGTGYTSIAQLLKLPINLLKIDKSLIDDIERNHMNRDLVDSVIYMGHVMNCEVISEGVETEKQLSLLNEHKCDFVQGFVWGKPMPYEEALKLYAESDKSRIGA